MANIYQYRLAINKTGYFSAQCKGGLWPFWRPIDGVWHINKDTAEAVCLSHSNRHPPKSDYAFTDVDLTKIRSTRKADPFPVC